MDSIGPPPHPSSARLNAMISEFARAKDRKDPPPVRTVSIWDALQLIKAGKWSGLITHLRSLEGEEFRDFKNKSLPAFTFSGTFTVRNDESGLTHSGVICADIDKLSTPHLLEAVFKKLIGSGMILAAWRSPSGKGIKALFPVEPNWETHRKSFQSVKEIARGLLKHVDLPLPFEKHWDDNCINESRLCFVSFDPELWINPEEPPIAQRFQSGFASEASDTSGTSEQWKHLFVSGRRMGAKERKVWFEKWADELAERFKAFGNRENHRLIFDMARASRDAELEYGFTFSAEEQVEIVGRWFEKNPYKTMSVDKYIAEFREAYSDVRFPFGNELFMRALDRAIKATIPDWMKRSYDRDVQCRLLLLLRELQRAQPNQDIYLPARTAVKALRIVALVEQSTCSYWMRDFRDRTRDIKEVSNGSGSYHGSRYRYTGSDL